jgi:hypothetical protein
MASFTDGSWDGSASRYSSTAAYCAACLIDLNESGGEKTQSNCKLPVREPGGAYNRNALRAAAAALAGARGGVSAPAEAKRSAARSLLRLMGQAGIEAGDGLRRMAGM